MNTKKYNYGYSIDDPEKAIQVTSDKTYTLFCTKPYACQANALRILSWHLFDYYVDKQWWPSWGNLDQEKFCIIRVGPKLKIVSAKVTYSIFAFKTEEDAKNFLETHHNEIKVFYQI